MILREQEKTNCLHVNAIQLWPENVIRKVEGEVTNLTLFEDPYAGTNSRTT